MPANICENSANGPEIANTMSVAITDKLHFRLCRLSDRNKFFSLPVDVRKFSGRDRVFFPGTGVSFISLRWSEISSISLSSSRSSKRRKSGVVHLNQQGRIHGYLHILITGLPRDS